MTSIRTLSAVLIGILLSSCASTRVSQNGRLPRPGSTVLIIAQSPGGGHQKNGSAVTQTNSLVTAKAIGYGYRVAARDHVQIAVREIQFSREPISDERASKIGRAASADAIILASVDHLSEEMRPPAFTMTVGQQGYGYNRYNQPQNQVYSNATVTIKAINVETITTDWISTVSQSGFQRAETSLQNALDLALQPMTRSR